MSTNIHSKLKEVQKFYYNIIKESIYLKVKFHLFWYKKVEFEGMIPDITVHGWKLRCRKFSVQLQSTDKSE